MSIKEQRSKLDAIITKGLIVKAVREFFAEDAKTYDYGSTATSDKAQMIEKMEEFAGSIAKVNEITLHHAVAEGNISASEFTFDFELKDGSKIYWHEIIRRIWNDDAMVVEEEYFNAD